jgi:co-chaperonin GroES (HSP10)
MKKFEEGTPATGMVLVKLHQKDATFLAEIPPSDTGEVVKVGNQYDDFEFKARPGDTVIIAKVAKKYEQEGEEYVIVNQTDVLFIWS